MDPRTQQRHAEYKEIQKSTDLQVKTDLSLEMKHLLESTMPEDMKAKLYAQTLNKYMKTTNKIPDERVSRVNINPIQHPHITKEEEEPEKKTEKKRRKKRQLSPIEEKRETSPLQPRRSSRKPKQSKWLQWKTST
jgi:hypothetical protein